MQNPITIPNPLPASLVALSGETLEHIARIEASAKLITTVETVEQMQAADALAAEAIKLDKAIEAERKRLKAPITELVQALDMASSEARTPLIAIKQDLGRLVLKFQAEENARREAARIRAEEERRRREEAAAAAHRAALEAQRKAEEAARAAVEADEPPPIGGSAVAPEPVEPVRVHVPEVVAPSYEEQQSLAPLKSQAVVSRTVTVVEIFDPSLVPDAVGDVPLWTIDTKAVEKLAKAGLSIPGVRVAKRPAIAAKG